MNFALKISFLFFLLSEANCYPKVESVPEGRSRNLSRSIERSLQKIQPRRKGNIETPSDGTRGNEQQLLPIIPESTPYFAVESQIEVIPTLQPPTKTELEEVNAKEGTIKFTNGANPELRRKIWVLQSEKDAFFDSVRFLLEENNLGDNARLSIWTSAFEGGHVHMWNGSQSDWREEQWTVGSLILVTLTISPSAVEQPSFKLKFETTSRSSYFIWLSELVRKDGRQLVSFPKNNTENYTHKSFFVAVIAPASGKAFQATLKYFDLPEYFLNLCFNQFHVYFLQENSTDEHYVQLTSSAYTGCGSYGNVSEPLGNSTVAILQFWTYEFGNGGKGFQVEVN